MLRKLDKKGSHVGLVVSFLIFIVFIAFLRIILEPSLYSNEEKKVILDDVRKEVIESASYEVMSTTVRVSDSISTDCVLLDNFIPDMKYDSRIIVKNMEFNGIPAFTSSTNSNSLKVMTGGTKFFKVYSSEGFDALTTSSQSCQSIVEGSGYTLGATIEKGYIFESLILDLIDSYSASPKFTSETSPASVNIGISFIYSNGTEIKTKDRSVTTNVFTGEDPIEYIDKDGNINPGELIIRIW